MNEYVRNCPSCGKKLSYKTEKSLSVCSRKNTKCRECMPKPNPPKNWLGKKHTKETIEKMRKAAIGRPGPNKGIPKSEETKRKMRLAAISRIEKNKGQCGPRYNPKACDVFENINLKFGWRGMHAENGGEYYIKELGYWVDYYEPTVNLVIEYDEKHHNYSIYTKRDILRQSLIEKELKCKFIRIKASDNLECIHTKIKELFYGTSYNTNLSNGSN